MTHSRAENSVWIESGLKPKVLLIQILWALIKPHLVNLKIYKMKVQLLYLCEKFCLQVDLHGSTPCSKVNCICKDFRCKGTWLIWKNIKRKATRSSSPAEGGSRVAWDLRSRVLGEATRIWTLIQSNGCYGRIHRGCQISVLETHQWQWCLQNPECG